MFVLLRGYGKNRIDKQGVIEARIREREAQCCWGEDHQQKIWFRAGGKDCIYEQGSH